MSSDICSVAFQMKLLSSVKRMNKVRTYATVKKDMSWKEVAICNFHYSSFLAEKMEHFIIFIGKLKG
jgi:hypothetical protein